jgi:hypothetical protein
MMEEDGKGRQECVSKSYPRYAEWPLRTAANPLDTSVLKV